MRRRLTAFLKKEGRINGNNGVDGEQPQQTSRKKKDLPPEFQKRLIHPALHIEPGFSSVGIVERKGANNVFHIMTFDSVFHVDRIKDALTTKAVAHPGLARRYRKVKNPPTLSQSVALLLQKMQHLVSFDDKRWYSLVATWSAGTYLFPAFPTYPYLNLTGEKGSGKTKVQDIGECVCFNALKILEPTPAVLFRMVHALRPTLFIDEVESLKGDEGKEVRSIINAGYKRGATVPRCEGEGHDLRFFEVYSPKCLAGIRGLGPVTEDRCITLIMSKPLIKDGRQNIPIDPSDPEWQTIRDGFYLLPFTATEKLFAGIDSGKIPQWLSARDRELWLPLIQLSVLIDEESKLELTDDLLGLAKETIKDKGLTFDAEAILGQLESLMANKDSIRIHPVDLVPGLEECLNRRGRVSPEWIATRLRAFGFKKAIPPRDEKGVIYEITAQKVEDLRCRYTPPE